jgi:tRNA pseudouridine38-40 synthase
MKKQRVDGSNSGGPSGGGRAAKKGGGGGGFKGEGPHFWKRSFQDTSARKHSGGGGGGGKGGGKSVKQDDDNENGEGGPDSDVEEENMGPTYEDRKKGSYEYDALKATKEYADRVELEGPKRKHAVCFAYLGSNYQGLQINPGCRSVEAELERALFLAGAISDCNFGNLQKLQWTRAARTDKGVHAIGQCCAMKLTVPTITGATSTANPNYGNVEGKQIVIDKTNSHLPPDIRVFGLSKVTKNFNAKIACGKRRYHYLLPTYMLMNGHTVTEALAQCKLSIQQQLANTSKEEYLAKCKDVARAGGYAEAGSTQFLAPEQLITVRDQLLKDYRVDDAALSAFRAGLNCFTGTHAFHNYTTGKSFEDANASRYIMSFTCDEPFLSEQTGVQWVLVSVVGQSFLLNQIRKMIGTACEVRFRNVAS